MFHVLEQTTRLEEGYSRCFDIDGSKMLLVKSGGEVRLIPIKCPHAGHSLKKARLHSGHIICPKHGIAFNLNSGQPVGGEPVADVAPLQAITLSEQNGAVGVFID